MVRKSTTITLVVLVAMFFSSQSVALLVIPDYGSTFSSTEKSVILEAIKEWADLLPCKDGFKTTISFYCDNDLGSLGETSNWVIGEDGYPTSSKITVDNDALNWTTGEPATGKYDAAYVLKHEIAHALGWTVGIPAFNDNVKIVEGNRFYDMNNDGVYNDNDFDLNDDATQGTHSAATGDLMYYLAALGERRHPTRHHAEVLADAYGYCVPEPASILMLLCLGFGTGLVRRLKN